MDNDITNARYNEGNLQGFFKNRGWVEVDDRFEQGVYFRNDVKQRRNYLVPDWEVPHKTGPRRAPEQSPDVWAARKRFEARPD